MSLPEAIVAVITILALIRVGTMLEAVVAELKGLRLLAVIREDRERAMFGGAAPTGHALAEAEERDR